VNDQGDYAEKVRETVERELKLAPGDGFVMPTLGEPLPTRVFVSTYHDTPDLRLARHGITFRHRLEDGAGLWQLKLPHGAHRIELEQQGPPARPPSEMTALLVAHLREGALAPVARLRTRRESLRALGAEIVEDNVSVLDGVHVVSRFRELEVELLDGDERTLRRLEKELRRAGAEPTALRPKLFRALELAEEPRPIVVPKDATPREAIALALAEQLRRMLVHDPGTRLGADPEDLHQLRVATRRARAFLRVARPLVDREWAEELRAELAWLGSALGPARDADVQLEQFRAEVAALGAIGAGAASLLTRLEERRAAARTAAVKALSDPRYLALLGTLEAIEPGSVPPGREHGALADVWAAELRRTRKAASEIGDDPPDDELHALRIRIKRLRYATELAAHELGRKKADRVVDAAKAVQDVLGEHQDAVVAETEVQAWQAAEPEAAPVAERLVERARRRRAEARSAWREAWTQLDRRAASAES
jgi:CHAD domain-containing protein